MKYSAQQLDAVAAEYVLGTLDAGARRRMRQLMVEREDARRAVWRWERALGGLCHELRPVTPPARVFEAIRRRLASPATSSRRGLGWLAGALPVAAAFLLYIFLQPPTAPNFERAAIINDAAGQALWVVKADLDQGTLAVSARGAAPAATDRDYELWLLPDGRAPISLGLLKTDKATVTRTLAAETLAALPDTTAVAVSLEPAGGSTTGAPTGPVLYQAKIVAL